MACFKISIKFSSIVIVAATVALIWVPTGGSASGLADFLDKQLASAKFSLARHFDGLLSFDNQTDDSYRETRTESGRSTDIVNIHYQRVNYLEPRITKTKGNHQTNKGVEDGRRSKLSFAVVQKSFNDSGTMTNRWDVKVNDLGHQFIGLYHGNDPFITNRMRSYAIRWIGNGIKDYLPILEEMVQRGHQREHLDTALDELKSVIKHILLSLAKKIRGLWDDMDYFDEHESSNNQELIAGGSVVVVTESYIVVTTMDEGQVLCYDDSGSIIDLTKDAPDCKLSRFVDGKNPTGSPYINIVPRVSQVEDGSHRKLKYLIIGTAPVVSCANQDKIKEFVDRQRDVGDRGEEEVCSSIGAEIINSISHNLDESTGKDIDANSESSVIVVSLDP